MLRGEGGRFGAWTFITGQFLTIVSTVIGVYLAGYVGFQRTLEYDRVKNAQDQLRLAEAMSAELDANLALLTALSERMDPSGANAMYEGDWPTLRLYVWRAAARSPALFELPPAALTGLQAFYDAMERFVGDQGLKDLYRSSNGGMAYDRDQRREQLLAAIERARTEARPALTGAAERPRRLLADYSGRYPELSEPR